jgi:Tol biopolymer transport system component
MARWLLRIGWMLVGLFTVVGASATAFTRVSVASDGTPAGLMSDSPALTASGQVVVFVSIDDTLVAGDDNGCEDIFVHDRQSGETQRVSVSSAGQQADAGCYGPAISGDGRFVTFDSEAATLVANDRNACSDVFVHDRQTGQTTRISHPGGGREGNAGSYMPAISADGRWIAFDSDADNLVAGDTNDCADVFLYDRQTEALARLSVSSTGTEGNSSSWSAAISGDGQWIAFESVADNLVVGDANLCIDLFLHARVSGATTRVSVSSTGQEADGDSWHPSLSADGRFLAFESGATALVPGDTNKSEDIFVRDRLTAAVTRVSLSSAGTEADNSSYAPMISAEGRFVIFESLAANLVEGDTNVLADIFLHDRQAGTIQRMTAAPDTGESLAESWDAAVNADATVIAFVSAADNLVADDINGVPDVLVRVLGGTSRPDLLIGPAGEPTAIGDDTFSLTGAEQVKALTTGAGAPAIYWVTAQNDGSAPEGFRLTLDPAPADWSMRLFTAATSGTEIPADALTAGWPVPVLAPGEALTLRLEVQPLPTVPAGTVATACLRLSSLGDATLGDAVQGQTTRLCPTVTLAATPTTGQLVGRPIHLVATGSRADLHYQFRVGYKSGATWHWTDVRPYASSPDCDWTPTEARIWSLVVWAHEPGSPAAYDAYTTLAYHIIPALERVSLSVAPYGPKPILTPIQLTAAATGGVDVHYQFRVGYKSGTTWLWTVIRTWGPERTCTWTPPTPRTWSLVLWAKEAGSPRTYDVYTSVGYTIYPTPPRAVSLSYSPSTPIADGTPITLTATPQGGTHVRYRFRVGRKVNGTLTWTTLQEYSDLAHIAWTPLGPGTYSLAVYARELGSICGYDTYTTKAVNVRAP